MSKAKPPIKATSTKRTGLVAAGEKPALNISRKDGENTGEALARAVVAPDVRHAFNISQFAAGVLPHGHHPDLPEMNAELRRQIANTASGDMTLVSQVLASQALSLDAMFTELARRSSLNMGDYPEASERYMRLALKAQSNSRSTLDALAKIHAPREQIVKHVQVHEGGQAVVADHFHAHRGAENGNTNGQPHAARTAGECPALPGKDPLGDRMPSTGRAREAAMSHARR